MLEVSAGKGVSVGSIYIGSICAESYRLVGDRAHRAIPSIAQASPGMRMSMVIDIG